MKIVSTGILLTALIVVLMTTPFQVDAASLYIDPAKSMVYRGDSITLSVRLDTDEEASECINAIDGVITYPSSLEPVDISVGDSIINVWVEQPVINREKKTITFAGGITNGYCGRVSGDPRLTNTLTKIIFRSPGFSIGPKSDETTAVVGFAEETTAYLNDGLGTKASLTTYPATIELNETGGANQINEWQDNVNADNENPEEFAISLVKGDGNFDDKYYIVFNTTDKQSGIDHYEIIEEPLSEFDAFAWGRADAPWITASQPPIYILRDQSLNSIIRVKAIDKAGNEYIATYIPDPAMRTLSTFKIFVIFMVVISVLVLGGVVFILNRYIKRKKMNKNGIGGGGYNDNTNHVEND